MSESLEARLAANPRSMAFARLAGLYLRQGNLEDALRLCVDGVKRFPRYGTGHLILGKCYEALGRNVEAMLEFRKALRATPDSDAIRQMLAAVEKKEEEAFRLFEKERTRRMDGQRDTLSAHTYVTGKQKEPIAKKPEERGPNIRIVTPTLAEIYATQGEYEEAIAAYNKLIEQRPGDAARYVVRVNELKELRRIREAEEPSRTRDAETE
ncbi:MAG TPA: tetratricopeptide repeat protein [Bacteroidota bacterium]